MADRAASRGRVADRVRRAFLGRRLTYTYEIVEKVAGRAAGHAHRAGADADGDDLRVDRRLGEGRTQMSLRNRGEPAACSDFAAPVMVAAMRRANAKDLARLKSAPRVPLKPVQNKTKYRSQQVRRCWTCCSLVLGQDDHPVRAGRR